MFKAKMPNLDLFRLPNFEPWLPVICSINLSWISLDFGLFDRQNQQFENVTFGSAICAEQVMNSWIKKIMIRLTDTENNFLNGFVNASWRSLMKGKFASFKLAVNWTLKHLSRVWSHLFIQKDLVKKFFLKRLKDHQCCGAFIFGTVLISRTLHVEQDSGWPIF